MKLNILYHILKNFIIQYNMKELLETLIKSQRERLMNYLEESNDQYRTKEIFPNAYDPNTHNRIIWGMHELRKCLNQLIILYNQIKNDSESTTTI